MIIPFFLVTFGQKCPFSDQKKWHFEWQNQNSKTTFTVQTFPKYGPYDFYFVNLSLLGAILAIFQFCWFSGLFWPFSHCKIGYFCKIRLSDLAQDESSDCDSENCSEISAVTWFRIYPRLLQIPTLIFFTPPYSSSVGVRTERQSHDGTIRITEAAYSPPIFSSYSPWRTISISFFLPTKCCIINYTNYYWPKKCPVVKFHSPLLSTKLRAHK